MDPLIFFLISGPAVINVDHERSAYFDFTFYCRFLPEP